ncbi:hypothetical protein MRBLAR21_002624 [Paenarthrobacter nitroguajacolicus]
MAAVVAGAAGPAGLALLIAVAVGVADQGGHIVAPVGVLYFGAVVDATAADLLKVEESRRRRARVSRVAGRPTG